MKSYGVRELFVRVRGFPSSIEDVACVSRNELMEVTHGSQNIFTTFDLKVKTFFILWFIMRDFVMCNPSLPIYFSYCTTNLKFENLLQVRKLLSVGNIIKVQIKINFRN